MVSCLFARGVYGEDVLADCLRSVGYRVLSETTGAVSSHVQKLRWQTRLRTGFDPRSVSIPKRFLEVETWRGPIDGAYLAALKEAYAGAILDLAREEREPGPQKG